MAHLLVVAGYLAICAALGGGAALISHFGERLCR